MMDQEKCKNCSTEQFCSKRCEFKEFITRMRKTQKEVEKSIEKASCDILHLVLNSDSPTEGIREVLLTFYKERTVEILTHLDEQGINKALDLHNLKIGGTSNE